MVGTLRPRGGRVHFGAALALLLAVTFPTDVLALTWGSNTAITTAGGAWAYRGGLAVSTSTTAHMVYENWVQGSFGTYYRRSTNSGSSWAAPILLSRPSIGEAGVPAIDANGTAVDAVWLEGDSILTSSDSVVVYRRSTDSGATWHDAMQVSPLFETAGIPRIAHGSGSSTVAVVWTNLISGRVYVRVSTDNGATFNSRIALGTTNNKPYGGDLLEAFPVVAFGSGVMYVAYSASKSALKLRRSTDGGVTWKSATSIASNAAGWWSASVAANGKTVLVGYRAESATDGWTAYRRSADKGASWGSAKALSPRSADPSFHPTITYRSGSFRAIYERCNRSCSKSAVYYRASATGSGWTSPSRASVRNRAWATPADVDVATKVLVLYVDYNNTANDVRVRLGTP